MDDAPAILPATDGKFTRQNAADMARRSHEARRARLIREAEADNEPQPEPQAAEFIASQVSRVRAHLERVDLLIEQTFDPQNLERLARARAVLAETERVLCGRPLPGSRRPGKEKPAERGRVMPLDD